jgi:oligopeptide transport system permease protein
VLVFTARRLGQAALAILVTTFVMHLMVFRLGNPFGDQNEKTVPPETQALLRAHFGLDKPLYLQYLIYLKNIFTGDFGVDFDQRRQVSQLLAAVAPNTLKLALLAIVIDILIGVLAGVVAAVWRDRFIDALIQVSTIVLLCLPVFVSAVFLRAWLSGAHLFGIELFPELPHRFGVEVPWYKEILLPAFALASVNIAFIARLMRTSMLEVLGTDYLRTARAKGLPERVVIGKHAVRNALIPVVNYVGIQIGILMGGAVLVEAVFQYNGLGYLFVRSLWAVNNPVMLAIAVISLITFIVLSAVVDILTAYLDPRIRIH